MQGCESAPVRARVLWCAVLLGVGLVPAAAMAQANLLANGGNPSLYDAGFMLPSSCSSSTNQASVTLKQDVAGELGIEIDNKSSCRVNYFLSLPLQGNVFNTNVANQPTGTKYTLSGRFKVVTSKNQFVRGTLGFSAALQGQGYGGGETIFNQFKTNEYQDVSYTYVAGVPDASGLPIQGTIVAQVITPDVEAGEKLTLRLRDLSMLRKDAATKVEVGPLLQRVQLAGAGKPLKLSIPVTPIALSGSVTKSLSLVDTLGVTRHTFPIRTVSYLGAQSWNGVLDTWSVQVPATLPEGRYSIRYALSLSGSQTQAGTGVATYGSAAAPSYEVGTLVVDNKSGMYVGQHFHRYPGNNQSVPIGVDYQLVRSLNHDGVVELGWWQPGEIQFGAIDEWARFHAGQDNAPVKKLLFTFFGSPSWLSSQPTLPNDYNNPNMLGMWASPSDMTKYSAMVTAVVNRHKSRIAAVECWNEPDIAFAGSGGAAPLNNQLADICKAIHVATKAVDPSIVTICPQASKPEAMAYWLTGRTAANEPVTNYCDMVGTHTYQRVGVNASGAPYSRQLNLVQTIQDMKKTLAELGVDKPLAITEMGFQDDVADMWVDNLRFSDKLGDKRGEIIYETLATARELGVRLFGLYSYDGGYKNGAVVREPWETCPAPTDKCYGLEGLATTDVGDRNLVIGRIDGAAKALGVSSATANGMPLQRLNLFMVPSTTAVNADGSLNVKFHITISNPGLTHAKGVAVSTLPSTTSYVSSGGGVTGYPSTSIFVLDSLTELNGTGSCALTLVPMAAGTYTQQLTQWTCQGLTVPAGGALMLQAAGRVVPTSAQYSYMGWLLGGYKYSFTQSLSVSWDGRGVPVPTLTSSPIVVSR